MGSPGKCLWTAENAFRLSILPSPRYFVSSYIFYDTIKRTFLVHGGCVHTLRITPDYWIPNLLLTCNQVFKRIQQFSIRWNMPFLHKANYGLYSGSQTKIFVRAFSSNWWTVSWSTMLINWCWRLAAIPWSLIWTSKSLHNLLLMTAFFYFSRLFRSTLGCCHLGWLVNILHQWVLAVHSEFPKKLHWPIKNLTWFQWKSRVTDRLFVLCWCRVQLQGSSEC